MIHAFYNDNADFTKISSAELTLYSADGSEMTIDFKNEDLKALAIMMKAIGLKIGKEDYFVYGPETQQLILDGKFNPFTKHESE